MTEINENSTFEEITARINEIAKALENNQTPLDESIGLFEEGVTLVKRAGKMLDDAQQKVKFLVEGEVK